MTEIKLKDDKYRKTRGGYSKLLDIRCEHCRKHLFYYQKDGPGALKRMYLDRIFEAKNIDLKNDLTCPYCAKLLAIAITFSKENRPAQRLFVGSIIKKGVRQKKSEPFQIPLPATINITSEDTIPDIAGK